MSAQDQLFLREIELHDFRSFGAECRIPLKPGPSVLVVTGPNGLGKTTLMEGIEWALTGGIRRFKDRHDDKAVDAALTRRAAGVAPGSHRVTLRFEPETIVLRGPDSCPDAEAVEAMLAHSNWPHRIHSLSTYLALTHFLSQSPTLRLTSRTPQQRWEDLKDLAGAAGVDRMLDRLARGTKIQLSNGAKKAAAERDSLKSVRSELEDLLQQARTQDTMLGAGAAWSAEVVLAETARLALRLQAAIGTTVPWPEDAAEALKTLASLVEQAGATAAAQRAACLRVETLLQPWQERAVQLVRIDDAKAQVNLLHKAVVSLVTAIQRRDRIVSRRTHLARLSALDAAIDRAAERLEECRRTKEVVHAAQMDVEAQNARLAAVEEDVRSDESILSHWRALAEEEVRVRVALGAVAEEASARADAEAALTAQQQRKTELEQEDSLAELALAEAERFRDAVARSVDEKAAHLSALIKDLHADDTECPLCLTHHTDGELLARAHRALERSDPDLKAATERLAEARVRRKACSVALAEHASQLDAANARVTAFVDRERTAREQADTLRHRERIGGRPLEGLAQWLAERVAAATEAVVQRRQEGRDLDPDHTLQDRRSRAANAVAHAEEGVEAAETELNRLKDERQQVYFAALSAIPGSLDLDPHTVDTELMAAGEAVARADTELESARQALDPELRTRMGDETPAQWARKALDRLDDQRATLVDEQAAALRIWQEAGLAGEPAGSTLMATRANAAALEDEARAVGERCIMLRSGYEQWLADERRLHLQQQIDKIVRDENAQTVDECLAKLDERVAQADAQTNLWTRARTLGGDLDRVVKDEKDTFYDAIIQPLAERANAFDRAWSSFPDKQIDFSHRRLPKSTAMETSVDGDPADLRLSEGQAGVKALSFLLAASTAHPWSRWRALLLDDPLQYNDLIHKAGFLDVLRPLVQAERYQVIMSTHDIEEAHFIERKCRNAGIAFTLLRLHALGKDGVVYSLE
ncbi:AAA family ATPase [Azospirillum largimobile]